jgi:hypothetical protein
VTSRPLHGAVGQTLTYLLEAVARVFVTPSGGARAESVTVAAAPSVAVCGAGAEPLACALALLLRGHGPAVVASWGAGGRRSGGPATIGARRVAASMAARGRTAYAAGRLVVVALDEQPGPAAAEAARAGAAAGNAPVVLALCAPRDDAFDELLAAQDLAIVAARDAPEELVRLAVAAFEAVGRAAVSATALTATSAWTARAGLWATPSARRALSAATDALR